ncbi:copper ABC transporter permease [Halorubrum salipaludis]|uniref:Copper ABC transporter permease n=1 Tax=Halorubrum salipaludis TaxID=2032630 RepID=A0A2A2FDE0_9EURY|nr:copper ABC transporter permease [Halorubrum salipaludis]PAU82595.1 copper ABC transporter permease [Halorubrum salipaludis]
MTGPLVGVATVFRRELATVVRTPGYAVLAAGLLVAVGGLLAAGGGGATGFVPAVVDLLLPTEALVPLAAVVLGYRALLADGASGELAVIRTYPVRVGEYVAGVLLARTVALVGVVGVPYAAVGVGVWLTAAPDTGIFATHAGIDSPLLYLRFLAFVLLLGAAYVSLAAAVSAVAASRRSAVALGVLALVAGVLGGDLLLLRSLGAGASPASIPGSLALTPNGAFRGLTFEHVIGVAFAPEGGFVSTGRAVGSLVGWTLLGALAAGATLAYGRRVDAAIERVRSGLAD